MPSELDIALSRLKGVKKTPNGYIAKCPCHDDKVASLSINETEDGHLLLYCHAGCSFNSIIKALDLHPLPDIPSTVIVATYDYTDGSGRLLYQVVRYHPKTFKQRRPDGQGGWIWDLKGITPTLYHMPGLQMDIRDDKMVFIVEGEKDVDKLLQNGQRATTISGGSSTKWHPSLVPLFQDAKVVITPDSDDAGRKYAQYVANLLYGWCVSLKVIALPSKDVSDYLETKTIDNLLEIVYNTSEYIPAGAVTREEFNSWRGVNQYLWQQIRMQQVYKSKRYNKYD